MDGDRPGLKLLKIMLLVVTLVVIVFMIYAMTSEPDAVIERDIKDFKSGLEEEGGIEVAPVETTGEETGEGEKGDATYKTENVRMKLIRPTREQQESMYPEGVGPPEDAPDLPRVDD